MADTSVESDYADVNSQDKLSLFDEEILFDQDPNEAYFRYMVGMERNDDNGNNGDNEEDNIVAVENEDQGASPQDNWTPITEVRKTLPAPILPPTVQHDVDVDGDPLTIQTPKQTRANNNNDDEADLERAEEERKRQERAARIAEVPPVIYVGEEPNVHMRIRAKNNIIPDWATLSATTDLSYISRNRRCFMLILLLFLLAVIGLAVALVINFQRTNELDNSSTVSSGQTPPTSVVPSSSPTSSPTQSPTQQTETETTVAPVSTTMPPAGTLPQTSTTSVPMTTTGSPTASPTVPLQTTTSAPPVTSGSPPTVSPTVPPTTAPPSEPPTVSPTMAAPTASPTRTPTTTPPTNTLSPELQELIEFLSDASPDGGEALSNQNSPQFQAAKWLSEEPSFSFYSDWKRIQRYVIATLYYSTNGDDWTNNDGWLSSQDECNWYETRDANDVCSNDGRYEILYIQGNNLKGQLPPEISLLSDSLLRLDVVENNLSGTIPTEFGLLTSLRKFSLKRNANIGGTLPTEIGGMASMAFFGVGRIDLTGTLPTEIGLWTNLETIGVERNNLEGKIPTEFGHLSLLRQAAFDFNQFTGTVPIQLTELPLLEKLALEYNDLTGVIEFDSGCPIEELKADCDEVECDCCNQCS